ncbi:MAG: hypothetical protein J6U54_05445 [Clostridiales bacterium]|nr:hypothetical protein [Clostridiales bacterium]
MKQYTSPVLPLLVEDKEISQSDTVYVTFSDNFRSKKLTFTDLTVENTEEGAVVSVHLTQEQTAMFSKNNPVDVQVNVVAADGERWATDIAKVCVGENLLAQVL